MTSRQRIEGLMDENPLMVYPSLAKALGLNTAIIIQQIHFLLQAAKNSRNNYVNVDNQWWVYNSLEEWSEIFTWLSVSTIQRTLAGLEDEGFIKSRQGVKDRFDRRKWYTIDYAKLSEVMPSIMSKWHDENVSKRHDDNKESDTTSESIAPVGAKPKRNSVPSSKMTLMKNAIVDAFRYDSDAMTKSEWGKIQSAAKQLCDVGLTPDDIPKLYAYCNARFTHFTPLALASNVSEWRKQGEKSTPPGFVSATAGLIFEN